MLKAYEDVEFLNRDECRAVRMLLEYLKPDMVFDDLKIVATMVIFGSARILPPDAAQAELAKARESLAAARDSGEARRAVVNAEEAVRASRYYQVAREFAGLVTRESQVLGFNEDRRIVVLTGGGPGIMEAGNRGSADAGGMSAALNIVLPHEQHDNPYITPEMNFLLHYFSVRKMHFLKRAMGLACFPGGFGTMDELFEALTMIQTKRSPRIPILLFGREFWEELIHWDVFVRRGLISPEDIRLFTYCETAQDGLDALCRFYEGNPILDVLIKKQIN